MLKHIGEFEADAESGNPHLFPKSMGKVYTPSFLAEWVASIAIEKSLATTSITILDPACGEGELLHAAKKRATSDVHLIGVDLDAPAIECATRRIGSDGNFITSDALIPDSNQSFSSVWKDMLPEQEIDIVIANPPWGADLVHNRANFGHAGYTLATGQFDSWDLFVELSLKIVAPRGLIAFIVPDAIFLPEHQPLRRLVQERATILMIARLGEGFFQNVYRGTTILVARNEPHKEGHQIETFRLSKSWRDEVLSLSKSLNDARKALRHFVPQQRFCDDEHHRWDIDADEKEWKTIRFISSSAGEWVKWLKTGRGVELSKSGLITHCPKCEWAVPSPRQPREIICSDCGHIFQSTNARLEEIIEKNARPKKNWGALIVGEDVDRYRARASRRIKLGVPGINYKNVSEFEQRRILVRKTGVGIKGSIVDFKCFTNQVVFHYLESKKETPPPFYLSYVLGVLCSRVMFAYHLKKNGENEWRSHPYLTQKMISQLPIPVPLEGEATWRQAKAIAKAVDHGLGENGLPHEADLRIECLAAGLYGLDEGDIGWVDQVISSAQALEPMRSLKELDLQKIRPLVV